VKIDHELSAGDQVDSRCLKCKAVTNHTIVAMSGGKIAKVECNTCRGRHNYRPESAPKNKVVQRKGEKISARAAGARISEEMKAAALFDSLLAGRNGDGGIAYAMTGDFAQGALIDHPTFGLGVVSRKISATRIEVVFRSGVKILVCGQPAQIG